MRLSVWVNDYWHDSDGCLNNIVMMATRKGPRRGQSRLQRKLLALVPRYVDEPIPDAHCLHQVQAQGGEWRTIAFFSNAPGRWPVEHQHGGELQALLEARASALRKAEDSKPRGKLGQFVALALRRTKRLSRERKRLERIG